MKLIALLDEKFRDALMRLNSQPLPIYTAVLLNTINNQIKKELNDYENNRISLLKTLSNKNQDGSLIVNESGDIQLDEDKKEIYISKLEETLNLEIELSKLDLESLDGIKISVNDLILLHDLIKY
jgi:hypothetical protein